MTATDPIAGSGQGNALPRQDVSSFQFKLVLALALFNPPIAMPEVLNLHPLFVQLQTRYPTSGLLTELVQMHADHFVVRAIVQLGSMTLATSLATAATVEQAEDQARLRVLALLGIHPAPSGFPELPFPSYSTPASPLTHTFKNIAQRSEPSDDMTLQNQVTPAALTDVETAIAPLSTLSALAFEPAPITDAPNIPLSTALVEPSAPIPYVSDMEPESFEAPSEDAPLDRDDEPYDDAPYDNAPDDEEPFEEPESLVEAASSRDRASTESVPAKVEESASKSKPCKPSASKEPPASEADTAGSASRDLSSLISQIGVEIDRIGWSKRQGSTYLQKTYGKKTRSELTDDELEDFLTYLNTQPSAGESLATE